MGTATIVVGVSLVIILVISAAVTLVWSDDGGPSDEPKIWPSQVTGGGM